MTLHQQAKHLLQYFQSSKLLPIEKLPLHFARESFSTMCKKLNTPETIAEVTDREIPGYKQNIGIRIYTPLGRGPFPTLVFFHGGGWVIGDIETHDPLCRSLANQAGCKVISVDYSLAPEEKFPVAVEDAYLSVKWVFENAENINVDANRVAVGGDSAGGNLAAVVCYLARERKLPEIIFQLLIYPSAGFSKTKSYEQYSEGYYLTKETMEWFRKNYLNSWEDIKNPLASPLLINDVTGLPKALVITAEYDPIRDGGEEYAMKLQRAGVPVECLRYDGMIHGFICMTEALDDGKNAITDMANALKDVFSKKG